MFQTPIAEPTFTMTASSTRGTTMNARTSTTTAVEPTDGPVEPGREYPRAAMAEAEDPDRTSRRASWQSRVLPRSVLGMSALLLSLALGASFRGAVLFAYYQYRLDQSDSRAEQFAKTFKTSLDNAVKTIQKERDDAKAEVRQELEPLQKVAATGATVSALLGKVGPSVWFVATKDENGAPSVGTAFAVFSDPNQSFLLTSLTTVRASTRAPGPVITVTKGGDSETARLVTWEDGRDLALLSIQKGGLPRLRWATGNPTVKAGDRVFSVSGLGSAGGSVSQGLVADVSAAGIQHDAPVGVQFQGGPLVNGNGEVVGVSSRTYAPLGFAPDTVWFAPPIKDACVKVLKCPSGDPNGVGG